MRKREYIGKEKAVLEEQSELASMYRLYAHDLYAYGLSIQPANTDIVENAIHDVFVELGTHPENLANIRLPKSYLLSVFRHRLIYLLKQDKRYVEMPEREIEDWSEEDAQTLLIESEQKVSTAKIIQLIFSHLNARQQEVLHLRFVEGFSTEEISKVMCINKQSVQNLLQRALKKIRKEFHVLSYCKILNVTEL